ncbi:MAG: sensor histidine kinase [Bacillota bacterium]
MSSKPVFNIYIKVISFSLLAALIVTNASLLLLRNIIGSSYDFNAISVVLFNFLIGASLAAICFALMLYVNKKINEISASNKLKKEDINQLLQNEINEKNRLIENISSLYDKTIKSSNQKSEFFHNMSHELKTPLTVILGAIQLIEQRDACAGVERRRSSKQLSIIKQNCYRLLRLINNILDLSRIESGYIKTNMLNCNIVYLVEEITQSVVPYAEQKGLRLEFDTLVEEIITAVDIDKIERILLNLLSNAIKFTKPGGNISVKMCAKDNNYLIIVSDTGIGIPKDMLDNIFERYSQVNSSLTREIEGSGIGLSIVKSFVDLHGGSIRVKSEQNKGSEFLIEIPVKICKSAPKQNPHTENSQNKIIEAINIEFSDIYSIAP